MNTELFHKYWPFFGICLLLISCNKPAVYDYAETYYQSKDQVGSVGKGILLYNAESKFVNERETPDTITIPYYVVDSLKIFQGDIIVDPFLDQQALQEELGKMNIKSLGRPSMLWPEGRVAYCIDTAFCKDYDFVASQVNKAIKIWKDGVGGLLNFELINSPASPCIVFRPGKGYASKVGMQGGIQAIYLPCTPDQGNIAHELGHALGLWHEHSRSDRNKFIKVDYTNISQSDREQFDVVLFDTTTGNLSYDLGSIMHYGKYALAVNKNKPTITPLTSTYIGNRNKLSALDISIIKLLYKH